VVVVVVAVVVAEDDLLALGISERLVVMALEVTSERVVVRAMATETDTAAAAMVTDMATRIRTRAAATAGEDGKTLCGVYHRTLFSAVYFKSPLIFLFGYTRFFEVFLYFY